MNPDGGISNLEGWIPVVAAAVAAISSRAVATFTLKRTPESMMRRNIDGESVPAILGWALVAGAIAGAVVVWAAIDYQNANPSNCPSGRICPLVLTQLSPASAWFPLIPVVGLFLAGLWDDTRGDERPRGFAGHWGALRGGAITGGVVKVGVGGLVAIATMAILLGSGTASIGDWILFGAPIALGANLINLLDRAPGRALKAFLILALPVAVLVPGWRVVAAGTIGAGLALLPVDLRGRGMLGDAGANPLGAMLGLGASFSALEIGGDVAGARPAAAVMVVVLVALNLASERWSFSKVIERTPWLARLDHLGRK